MTALITLVAVGLFAAAGFAGIIGVASVAIRREEKDLTLTREATGTVTRAGRALNGCTSAFRARPLARSGRRYLSSPRSPCLAWSSTVGKGVLRR